MEKYSDLSDKLTELQVKQNSEIGKLFNEILEDYKELEKRYNEVEKQCIDYETSTELGLGYELLEYGKILKVLYNCFNGDKGLEDLLKDINNLYDLKIFENSGYVLKDFENKIIEQLRKNNYEFGPTLMDLTDYVEHSLIMNTILETTKIVKQECKVSVDQM